MARSLDRKLKFRMERMFIGARLSSSDRYFDAVLVAVLHPVHGLVGLLDETFGGERVVGIGRDPERRGNARLESDVLQEDVALDGAADALGDDERAGGRG